MLGDCNDPAALTCKTDQSRDFSLLPVCECQPFVDMFFKAIGVN